MATILFFGKLADIVGVTDIDLTLPSACISFDELITILATENGDLETILRNDSIKLCINHELLIEKKTALISAGDEVAFLPPFSGG